jgi:hypothetical protein
VRILVLAGSRPAVLHALVARAAAAFGGGPADVVERTLALAGLAVQAVRRVGRFDLVTHRLDVPCRAEGGAPAGR